MTRTCGTTYGTVFVSLNNTTGPMLNVRKGKPKGQGLGGWPPAWASKEHENTFLTRISGKPQKFLGTFTYEPQNRGGLLLSSFDPMQHRNWLAVLLLASLAIAACVFVTKSESRDKLPVLLTEPSKVAAHARLVELAERDTSRLLGRKENVPMALKTLDPLAQTVSLSEDDRIIAKARREVLAAKKEMAHMQLFQKPAMPEVLLSCALSRAHSLPQLAVDEARETKKERGCLFVSAKTPLCQPLSFLSEQRAQTITPQLFLTLSSLAYHAGGKKTHPAAGCAAAQGGRGTLWAAVLEICCARVSAGASDDARKGAQGCVGNQTIDAGRAG